jgi:two-component system, NtrC family, sensor kinase
MKLAAKLISCVIFVIIIVLSIDGYVSIRREIELIETDTKRDVFHLGHALKSLVVDVWHSKGQAYALQLIEDANQKDHPVHVRWVWLDALPGDPHRPSVPQEKLKEVKNGREMSFKQLGEDGIEYFYAYIPISVGNTSQGALELSESLAMMEEYTDATVTKTLILIGTSVLWCAFVVIGLGIWLVGRPLQRLTDKTRRVGTGDFSGKLHLRGHDELAELAESTNEMCDKLNEMREQVRTETEARITALEQLRHEDRLRTVGRLASGVAHELGTPLNVVSGRSGMIASGKLSTGEIVENADIIKSQTERMATIIRQLLDFARRSSSKKREEDLRSVVRNTLDILAPMSKKHRAVLCLTDDGEPATAKIDDRQIEQVLTNLIINALQAMPRGGKVEVSVGREYILPPEGQESTAGEFLCIHVQDQGEGISEENMRHLFDPFFTTKDVGIGTGLGLSIAHGIVREHGGWIKVESEPGKGSRFSVYLPSEA